MGDCDGVRHPSRVRVVAGSVGASAVKARVRREPPKAPISLEFFRQDGVEREATPCQRLERSTVTPIERQKSTRFAGGCASNSRPLHDYRPKPAASEEVGY